MFERAFHVAEYEPRHALRRRRPQRRRRSRSCTTTSRRYGFRVEGDRDARVLGRLGPCDELVELARDADLFVCEATLERGEDEASLAATSPRTRPSRPRERAHAKRLLLTHRPQERSVPNGHELAYDGLQTTV